MKILCTLDLNLSIKLSIFIVLNFLPSMLICFDLSIVLYNRVNVFSCFSKNDFLKSKFTRSFFRCSKSNQFCLLNKQQEPKNQIGTFSQRFICTFQLRFHFSLCITYVNWFTINRPTHQHVVYLMNIRYDRNGLNPQKSPFRLFAD